MQEFIKIFRNISQRFSSWELWSDFIIMFACSISNAVDKSHFEAREALYMKAIEKYNPKEADAFAYLCAETVMTLEKKPEQDYLGSIFMALGLGNAKAGQFFTPYSICKAMAEISVGNVVQQIEEHGYITINDCACGAGATLIAGVHEVRKALEDSGSGLNWQNHVLVAAQDIDYISALMCYIQLSLQGCAAYVKIGDTLTDPMAPGDSKENYWYTPMYFMEPWPIRRLFHLLKENENHEPEKQTP